MKTDFFHYICRSDAAWFIHNVCKHDRHAKTSEDRGSEPSEARSSEAFERRQPSEHHQQTQPGDDKQVGHHQTNQQDRVRESEREAAVRRPEIDAHQIVLPLVAASHQVALQDPHAHQTLHGPQSVLGRPRLPFLRHAIATDLFILFGQNTHFCDLHHFLFLFYLVVAGEMQKKNQLQRKRSSFVHEKERQREK